MSPRQLNVTVLFVDDQVKELERCVPLLQDAVDAAAQLHWPHQSNPLKINVTGLSPDETETTDEFHSRYHSIISCKSDHPQVSAESIKYVIFDQYFEMPPFANGAKLSGDFLANELYSIRADVSCMILSRQLDAGAFNPNVGRRIRRFAKSQLSTKEGAIGLVREIVNSIKKSYATPFWSALQSYASEPKLVLHALASADGRTGERSVTTDEFVQKFGAFYFQTEASSTSDPLDSLLAPHSSIQTAQSRFAADFGADFCRFVTAGTSTANKIIYEAFCDPGDIVLLDRNCHISHHFGIKLAKAVPYYIDPYETDIPGIDGSITEASLRSSLEDIYAASGGKLPRIISVTNCTFDGIMISTKALIETVVDFLTSKNKSEQLSDIVFLIDEAWFSFARFHPKYLPYSAMWAVSELRSSKEPHSDFMHDNLRLYVTQSIHKTAFSFRQGSVIAGADTWIGSGLPESKLEATRFKYSFKAFTTTSPHMGMLASMDVGRRQMVLEGCELVGSSLRQSAVIRELFDNSEPGSELNGTFEIPEPKRLLPRNPDRLKHAIDATKLNIRSPHGLSGNDLRSLLWQDHQIQVNKFAADSVTCMLMPGFTDWQGARLIDGFVELSANLNTVKREAKTNQLTRLGRPHSERKFLSSNGSFLSFVELLEQEARPQKMGLRDAHLEIIEVTLSEDELSKLSNETLFAVVDFITPYPPGYPVFVPGELITLDDLRKMISLSNVEVHGLEKSGGGDRILLAKAS